ncbi:MAG: hypothetical protein SFW09_00145 [Hyphomicrobiaceae bacterium]|nr:hypothetical protein [Hyphomicrobiaceae bacterium]
MGLLLFLRDIVVALVDLATGRRRRRYEHVIDILAPRDIVWQMLKARDIVFDGLVPLRIQGEPVPGRPDCERVHILAGTTELIMLTRIVDERPGQAILYEILPDGTAPALIEGSDDYVGFVLADGARGTRLDLVRETSPARWISRVTIPVGLRSGGRRYKRKAEQMASAAAIGGLPGA